MISLTVFYPQSLRVIKLWDTGALVVARHSSFHVQCSKLKSENPKLDKARWSKREDCMPFNPSEDIHSVVDLKAEPRNYPKRPIGSTTNGKADDVLRRINL